jgi:acetate---CoA ligase (ADP-forming)
MLTACMKLARYGQVASGGGALEPRNLPDTARTGVEPALLDEVRTAELLDQYGLTLPATEIAINAEDAVAMAEKIGYPVVVKVADPQVLHKTEIGGVALNLRSAGEVRSAYQEVHDKAQQALNGRAPAGISVSEQVSGGVEMLVGGVVDPMFGPFVLVGAGGIWTEILHDVSMRAAPVLASEAREMIMSLRAAPLLTGARGQPSSDVDALVAAVTAVSRLLSDNASELAEIDLNPVAVLPEGQGLRVLDQLLTGFASER